jgi:hypothetical protein
MTSAIRWRIVTLQAFLVVVLAAASGFAFIEGSFVTSQVRNELTAQQIYFPAADQIKTGGALDPAEFPQEIRDQAGNQVTDGNQARIYANDFIGKHLEKVANGDTYASIGPKISALQAQQANLSKDDPQYTALGKQITTMQGQRATLLTGETLRGMLLNSYGWWTFGMYTTYAAFGLLIASLGVLGALVFEVVVAARKPEKIKLAQKAASTTA